MSPEQAAGDLDRLGPRSDVYSLGATLYCLLTGKPPFEGDDIGDLLAPCRRANSPSRRKLDPSIDQALEAVCLKAMALQARGPLCYAPGPGRRHRALDGRRAGDSLARAVLTAGTTVGAAEPHRGGHGGCGGVDGLGRHGHRFDGADQGQQDLRGQHSDTARSATWHGKTSTWPAGRRTTT